MFLLLNWVYRVIKWLGYLSAVLVTSALHFIAQIIKKCLCLALPESNGRFGKVKKKYRVMGFF